MSRRPSNGLRLYFTTGDCSSVAGTRGGFLWSFASRSTIFNGAGRSFEKSCAQKGAPRRELPSRIFHRGIGKYFHVFQQRLEDHSVASCVKFPLPGVGVGAFESLRRRQLYCWNCRPYFSGRYSSNLTRRTAIRVSTAAGLHPIFPRWVREHS